MADTTQPQFTQFGAFLGPTCEIGTWTPTLNCAGGNGDLVTIFAAISGQFGSFTRIGNILVMSFRIVTTTFTYTTAAGALRIAGSPFPFPNTILALEGSMIFSGFTKAGYTQMNCSAILNSSLIGLQACGSAQSTVNAAITDFPSGGTLILQGTGLFQI